MASAAGYAAFELGVAYFGSMNTQSRKRSSALRWHLVGVLLVLGIGLSRCVSDDPIATPEDSSALCDTMTVRFSAEIRDVLRRHCWECHASSIATAGVILDTYNGVNARVTSGQLLSAVRQDNRLARPMPNARPRIPLCDLRKIEIWVAAGAPNN